MDIKFLFSFYDQAQKVTVTLNGSRALNWPLFEQFNTVRLRVPEHWTDLYLNNSIPLDYGSMPKQGLFYNKIDGSPAYGQRFAFNKDKTYGEYFCNVLTSFFTTFA